MARPRHCSHTMSDNIEVAIMAFYDWEAEISRIAKEKAREWYNDYRNDEVNYISYNTSLCKIDEVYLLTKIQTILMFVDIVIEYSFEKSERGGAYKWEVDIHLYDKDDLPESESESESEGVCEGDPEN